MSTITVEVPEVIAKKYWDNVVDYKVFLASFENDSWKDYDLDSPMEAWKFYDYLKKEL